MKKEILAAFLAWVFFALVPAFSWAQVCNDGLDNDGDGLTDWPDDPDCIGPTDDELKPRPVIKGAYPTSDYAYGLDVSGNLAYVADGNSGLRIIDVSDPASPALVGNYDTSDMATGVYVSGDLAYVTVYASGLQIIDVSDPASPALEGSYDTPDIAYTAYVSGNHAYVADYTSGLLIIDVSNPAAPTLEGSYDTPGSALDVYVSGNLAYVADGNSGLQIIDVSNPAAPTLAGSYDTPDLAAGVYVSGNYAYVADYTSGLQIIDVSNPAAPTLAGSYDTPGGAKEIYVSGNHAYVADYDSGLQIIDVYNPAAPTLAGNCDTSDYAYGVYVSGNYAYVVDRDSGLKIISINDRDQDGISDWWELDHTCVSADTVDDQGDPDADGFTNYQEFFVRTDPCDPDTDDDGMPDGWEVSYACAGISPLVGDSLGDGDADGVTNLDEYSIGIDPCNPDTDGDTIWDGEEVNTYGTNPALQDSDGDGLNDFEEIFLWSTDPKDSDMDGDGLSDYDEIMTYNTDPWIIDSDFDGLADGSEIWVTGTDPLDPDSDDDGTPDGGEAGSALTDGDSDNMPGSWEDLFSCVDATAGDSAGDPDGDSLTNIEEYGYGTDPCLADTDGDSVDDGDEVTTYGTDPANPDSDGDGLSDGEEVGVTGTNPNDPDSDNDGYSDGAEVEAGTDPNLDTSFPAPPSHLINYQGRLTDAAGISLGDTTVYMTFAIFDCDTGGYPLWNESQYVDVIGGIYHVLLGSATPLDPSVFTGTALYLDVEVEDEILTPRQRITSVPFAIKAGELLGGRQEIDTRPIIVPAGASRLTIPVSFKQEFNAPPQVMVTFGGIFGNGQVSNITTIGFELSFMPTQGTSGTFTYQAFGD